MTNKSPIFTIDEPQHFSDYGFDPQIDYFQVFEEAITHKRKSSSFRSAIDSLNFKLQKPVSRDDNSKKIKKSRKRWWKNALCFFKRKRNSTTDNNSSFQRVYGGTGPVYLADSRSGYSSSRSFSGQLAGKINIPYIDLNEFNMEQSHRISPAHVPIYLVT